MTINGAITQLVMMAEDSMMPNIFRPALDKVIETISELEPQPRKKGKWIYYDPNGFKCSRCGRYLEIGCGDVKMNFCPNCGCQMNGGEQE